MLSVTNADIDARRHDGYLGVISVHGDPLGKAMFAMALTAGAAARSLALSDFASAAGAMSQVRDRAVDFLHSLAVANCPDYLRGADDQLQDALKLLADGGRRGAVAAAAQNGAQLTAAAEEMDVANRDILAAAQRIIDWRSGAARP
jgi:hypothetical protein